VVTALQSSCGSRGTGRELFVSEHTVARHVQNIFAKLAVAPRVRRRVAETMRSMGASAAGTLPVLQVTRPSDPSILGCCATVGRQGRHNVADPAERPAAADPQTGRDDQPEDPAQKIAVVELTQAESGS